MNIRKLFDSSVSYYEAEHSDKTGAILARQFPASAAVTPATKCCGNTGGKCKPAPTTFQDTGGTWSALNFSVDDPFYYSYKYTSSGTDTSSKFSADAYGDLNCNGTYSTFERVGSVDAKFNVTGGAGLYVVNDIE